ncbi:DUF1439 domain-containing protein [Paraferrimonas haliotis]|uniref:DUF1439 domain-containing protein n=1 Tax=Paraferrimonas haliotis TaxID=2013866 RepID=A0AA37TVC5_9GAMM|nr:DUF1439 domain-containing protein [Paraferrimonas haliotis]GLS83544.1 hypothetical protein GCM10007894_15210 [Paraferrimonas haliotis]
MRRFKQALIITIAILAQGCASKYSVSEGELEGYIQEHVGYETKTVSTPVFRTEVSLNDISVTLGHKQDTMKVSAQSKIKVSNPLFPLSASVFVEFEAKPYYNAEQQALYLRELQLVSMKSDPPQLNEALSYITPQTIQFLRYFLESQPVYRLDQKQWSQAVLAKFTKGVEVTPGYINFSFTD